MQTCPICYQSISLFGWYPRSLCRDITAQACSKEGRPLRFAYKSLPDGYAAQHEDMGEPFSSRECYIYGIKFYAKEHHFEEIEIQKM